MITARNKIERKLDDAQNKLRLATEIVGRRPNLNDGRLEYWRQRIETLQEVLQVLDAERYRLALLFQKEFGPEENQGTPWCEPCHSYHMRPRDKQHHSDLKCFAPWYDED
jgi:hypothetical protein